MQGNRRECLICIAAIGCSLFPGCSIVDHLFGNLYDARDSISPQELLEHPDVVRALKNARDSGLEFGLWTDTDAPCIQGQYNMKIVSALPEVERYCPEVLLWGNQFQDSITTIYSHFPGISQDHYTVDWFSQFIGGNKGTGLFTSYSVRGMSYSEGASKSDYDVVLIIDGRKDSDNHISGTYLIVFTRVLNPSIQNTLRSAAGSIELILVDEVECLDATGDGPIQVLDVRGLEPLLQLLVMPCS